MLDNVRELHVLAADNATNEARQRREMLFLVA